MSGPSERLLFVLRPPCTASHSLIIRARLVKNRLERRHRLREQLRPRNAAGRSTTEQMRLQRCEAGVAHLHRAHADLGDAALSFACERAMLLSGGPVLDVPVDGPRFRHLPALPRIETAEDIVGRIVNGADDTGVKPLPQG